MNKAEFVSALRGEETRKPMLEGLTALLLSACDEIPEDVFEQDVEFDEILNVLMGRNEDQLIGLAKDVNLIE